MKTRSILLLTALCVLSLAMTASAVTWNDADAGDSNWTTDGNWDGGAQPTSGGSGVIGYTDNTIANVNNSGAVCNNLYVGFNSSGNTLNVNAGDLTTASSTYMGYAAAETGTINISGGTLNLAPSLVAGRYGTGTINQTGGIVAAGTTYLGYYNGSSGSLTAGTGGSTTLGSTYIGYYAGATGSLTVNSGGSVSSGYVLLGNAGSGAVTINGGVVDMGSLRMGNSSSGTGTGTLNINGGTLTSQYYSYIGLYGTSTATQTGGSYTVGGGAVSQHGLAIGRYYAGSDGTYTISGGSLSVSSDDPSKGIAVGGAGDGTLKIIGSDATITSDHYNQAASGTLITDIDAGGITLLDLTGDATLAGTFEILDSGAALGTYDIITTSGGMVIGDFASVTVDGTDIDLLSDWSYAINGSTLSVTVIPEPATLGLVAVLGGGMIAIRRKFLI